MPRKVPGPKRRPQVHSSFPASAVISNPPKALPSFDELLYPSRPSTVAGTLDGPRVVAEAEVSGQLRHRRRASRRPT